MKRSQKMRTHTKCLIIEKIALTSQTTSKTLKIPGILSLYIRNYIELLLTLQNCRSHASQAMKGKRRETTETTLLVDTGAAQALS